MKKQIEVKLPYLVKSRKGNSFVEYRCFNPLTNKLERYRHYKGFKGLRSQAEVEKYAEGIIEFLRKKLLAGWRPWKDDQYIYFDQTNYYHLGVVAGNQRQDGNHIRKYLSDYLSLKKNDLTSKSFQSYQSKTRLFVLWLEREGMADLRIKELNNDVIVKFFTYLINERKLDKVTISKYRQTLHNMFSYFLEKELITEIPLKHLPKSIKKVDCAARPMTDRHMAEYLRFVAENDPQLLLASVFQLLLLCRPNREMRLIRIQDIDLTKQLAYIRDETAKTKGRVITMPTALVEIAESWEFHRYPHDYFIFGKGGKPGPSPVGINYFNRKFSEYKKKLDLPNTYKFYSFKHTGAGKLLESGATIAELMSHLGHTNFESTIHYIRRHFGERSEKIVNFNPDFLKSIPHK